MSLDVGVGDGSSFIPLQNEPKLSLDDDGYYWFLFPFFESLGESSGQFIDLYGDASFSDWQLALLENMLEHARQGVDLQPQQWDVCTGAELQSLHKKNRDKSRLRSTYSSVTKGQFLSLLDHWERIVMRAKELGKPVVCFGD